MEWKSFRDLRDQWFKIFPHHRDDSQLKQRLCELNQEKSIEKRYEGTPPDTVKSGMKLSGYLYVRRIVKKIPRTRMAEKKLDGTYGLASAKERARKNMKS